MKKFAFQFYFVIATSLWIYLFDNQALFKRLLEAYPINADRSYFLVALILFFGAATLLFLLVIARGRFTRWILAAYLIVSAMAGYYMDHYGVVIDSVMIDNIFQTNPQELAGLLSPSMAVWIFFVGLIPAALVWKYCPIDTTLPTGISRWKWNTLLVVTMLMCVIPFTADFAYFLREHKITRCFSSPVFYSYSAVKFAVQALSPSAVKGVTPIALDAKFVGDKSVKKLVIMVVGETARFDRFELNGYSRPTNPKLSQENVLSLKNVTSCGTSTGVSVPCMFSVFTRKEYEKDKALHTENALDILAKHNVAVLWRDNNSDSKGVATRLPYENFQSTAFNPVCDEECRDIGMLSKLDNYIEKNKNKDILIVLHQMGNHGPEYYRRYPPEFAKFKPLCKTGELSRCSQDEVDNSYDNAILYTDYFLAEIIHFLKKYDAQRGTAMLYVSDHGESLGEHGIYLHAAPYAIAPKEQTHVPAIIWLGKQFGFTIDQLTPYQDKAFSHDDVFCTLLGAFQLTASECTPQHAWLNKGEFNKSAHEH